MRSLSIILHHYHLRLHHDNIIMDSTTFNNLIKPIDYYQVAQAYFKLQKPFQKYYFNADEVHEPPKKQIKLKCEECDATYSSQKRLDNHIEKYHMKKNRHRCSYCRSSFRRRGKLLNHGIKAHPEKFQEAERIERNQPSPTPQTKPSIFHSIELLAQSDCKDSSTTSS